MDDTAIRTLTESVRELTAELRGVVQLLSASRAIPAKRGRIATGNQDEGLVERHTWLTPIEAAWDSVMGAGSFPLGSALKPLSQLRKKGNTEHEIARRLAFYCRHMERAGETQFMSVPAFAKTFSQWDPVKPAFEED
jgi:hypothetical protein